jgi:single-strand DNA-binding protein
MNTIKNSVQLMGNLGRDIELTTFENGNSIAKGTIATNEYYTNANGEKITDTQWHNIVAWGKLAQNMATILKKGSELTVKGKLAHRSYEDKEGNKKYITEVVVSEFLVLSKKEVVA